MSRCNLNMYPQANLIKHFVFTEDFSFFYEKDFNYILNKSVKPPIEYNIVDVFNAINYNAVDTKLMLDDYIKIMDFFNK